MQVFNSNLIMIKVMKEIIETLMKFQIILSNLLDQSTQRKLRSFKFNYKVFNSGGKIMFCGNGGSAADAQHLSAELVGRYMKNRKPLASISLTTDTSVITAISNDFSFDEIFSRQIESIGNEGDILYAISTSSKSKNVIAALKNAKSLKIKTIGLRVVRIVALRSFVITYNVPQLKAR